jgi:hypothetical protein
MGYNVAYLTLLVANLITGSMTLYHTWHGDGQVRSTLTWRITHNQCRSLTEPHSGRKDSRHRVPSGLLAHPALYVSAPSCCRHHRIHICAWPPADGCHIVNAYVGQLREEGQGYGDVTPWSVGGTEAEGKEMLLP